MLIADSRRCNGCMDERTNERTRRMERTYGLWKMLRSCVICNFRRLGFGHHVFPLKFANADNAQICYTIRTRTDYTNHFAQEYSAKAHCRVLSLVQIVHKLGDKFLK